MENSMLECKIMHDKGVREHVKVTQKGAYSVSTSGCSRRKRIVRMPAYRLTRRTPLYNAIEINQQEERIMSHAGC